MNKTMDDNLKSFIRAYVSSLVVWAVIVFYHQNPGVRDRISDLSRHLGRCEDDIKGAVEHLVLKGLLKREETGSDTVYIYEPSPDLLKQVNAFVNALDIRDLRLWILSEVLDK